MTAAPPRHEPEATEAPFEEVGDQASEGCSAQKGGHKEAAGHRNPIGPAGEQEIEKEEQGKRDGAESTCKTTVRERERHREREKGLSSDPSKACPEIRGHSPSAKAPPPSPPHVQKPPEALKFSEQIIQNRVFIASGSKS